MAAAGPRWRRRGRGRRRVRRTAGATARRRAGVERGRRGAPARVAGRRRARVAGGRGRGARAAARAVMVVPAGRLAGRRAVVGAARRAAAVAGRGARGRARGGVAGAGVGRGIAGARVGAGIAGGTTSGERGDGGRRQGLEAGAQVLGDAAEADAGEVVDGEAHVARVVGGEDAREARPEDVVAQALLQLRHAHGLDEVLEEDLDEDAAAGGRLVLVEVHHAQHVPGDGVAAEHVPEEAGDVAQPVGLVAVDRVVVIGKRLLKQLCPQPIQLRKALASQAIELGISALLRAALDDHGRKLRLLAGGQIDLHKLVAAFLKVDARHDGQVDGAAEVDEVGVGLIFDLHRARLGSLLLVRAALRVAAGCILLLAPAFLAQNFRSQRLVGVFVLLPLGIKLENVQGIFHLHLIIKTNLMRNLVLFLNQVQLVANSRVVLVSVFAHLEEYFDHVLHPLVQVLLVQDIAELIKHHERNRTTHLLQMLSDLARQPYGNLHAVVGRLVQQ